MEWHVNDLSLDGQFADAYAFRPAIESLLDLRVRRVDVRSRLFSSRTLAFRPVTPKLDLRSAILALADKVLTQRTLQWLANSGPFWDDERTPNAFDCFHLGDDEDVTDQGLGEAARRCLEGVKAHAFSFEEHRFQLTPLVIKHGLPQEILSEVVVENFWKISQIESCEVVEIDSWTSMMDAAKAKMGSIVFSAEISSQLRPYPFDRGVALRILELLEVLDRLASETQADSKLTEQDLQITQMYFVGKKASFTDESVQNKIEFKSELTFPDPVQPGRTFLCPWHGKVKKGQYRIHFEWPRPHGQTEIKVVYIGPKITKR